jgi:ketosteroid isomerase-like protein
MPVTPRRNILFAVLLSAVLLLLPMLGGDVWGAVSVPTAVSAAESPPCEPVAPEAEKAAIFKVITAMEAAWNLGDFRGYMQGFKNPDVIFVSGGRFQDGWQGTLDHYIRDYGASAETRGTLRFYDIRIEMLGPDAAQLISRYQLVKQQHPQYGINTRLMRKVNGEWVIALNHVSSSETPPVDTLKDKH